MPTSTLSIRLAPRKKPLLSPWSGCSRPSTTTVAPWAGADSRYDATLSRCCRVMRGPICDAGSSLGPTVTFGSRTRIASTSGVRHVAHGDNGCDGHAALSGRVVTRRHRRVGGHLDVRVGQDEHVVLRAAEGLDALAVPCRGLVDVSGDRRAPDEADRRDVRVLKDPVHGHLVALDDRKDA